MNWLVSNIIKFTNLKPNAAITLHWGKKVEKLKEVENFGSEKVKNLKFHKKKNAMRKSFK